MLLKRYLLLFFLLLNTKCFVSTSFAVELSKQLVVGLDAELSAIAIQPDGKVIIGGRFTSVLGVVRNRVARLNVDGSLDTIFNPNVPGLGYVTSIAVQPDGKIILAGDISSVGGETRYGLARVEADGSLDKSFMPNLNRRSSVNKIYLQADGNIIIAGSFTRVDDIARNGLARLNAYGALDETFDVELTGAGSVLIESLTEHDGDIYLAGSFTEVNGTERKGVARVDRRGIVDMAFYPKLGIRFSDSEQGVSSIVKVNKLFIRNDGHILLYGHFDTINDVVIGDVFARGDLSLISIDRSANLVAALGTHRKDVEVFGLQLDGKILLIHNTGISRLHGDGSTDSIFVIEDSDLMAETNNGCFSAMAVTPDNKYFLNPCFNKSGGGFAYTIAEYSIAAENPSIRLKVDKSGRAVNWMVNGQGQVLKRVTAEQSKDGVAWGKVNQGVFSSNKWRVAGLKIPEKENTFIRLRGYYSENSGSVLERIESVFIDKIEKEEICFALKTPSRKLSIICL